MKSLPPQPRILIIRFSSLGDVVKCTGLPRQIRSRYPQARITFLTSDTFLPLVRGNPHLHQALGFARTTGLGGLLKLAGELRREKFDLVVDVHQSLRSRLLSRLTGAPVTAYSKRTLQRVLLLWFGWNTYATTPGKEQDFLAALAPWGVTDDGGGTEIHLGELEPPGWTEKFRPERAQLEGWKKAGRPVLGLAPVAAWELKRWPEHHVSRLVELFLARTKGGVMLFGGNEDRNVQALARQLKSQGLEDRVMDLSGKTTLLESAWWAAQTQVMVANDTGMSHIAEAVGRPVVALFGPTTRHLGYFPVRPGSVVAEVNLPCRPCSKNGKGRCKRAVNKECLELVTPEQVLDLVLERL
ncbi:MAG: glycosyltransferase family 9 protein [Deltaproteobacteria bacterium]|nr:glycosyltransferase family 9 protein [Deltaproteobacteria bacterium]MDH4122068.1 glycosyltransferase family 9 protein [Deltaproteobacteria bacterium]